MTYLIGADLPTEPAGHRFRALLNRQGILGIPGTHNGQAALQAKIDVMEDESPADSFGGNEPYVRQGEKLGRNDPCPCGSGRKYKQCHGKLS